MFSISILKDQYLGHKDLSNVGEEFLIGVVGPFYQRGIISNLITIFPSIFLTIFYFRLC